MHQERNKEQKKNVYKKQFIFIPFTLSSNKIKIHENYSTFIIKFVQKSE